MLLKLIEADEIRMIIKGKAYVGTDYLTNLLALKYSSGPTMQVRVSWFGSWQQTFSDAKRGTGDWITSVTMNPITELTLYVPYFVPLIMKAWMDAVWNAARSCIEMNNQNISATGNDKLEVLPK